MRKQLVLIAALIVSVTFLVNNCSAQQQKQSIKQSLNELNQMLNEAKMQKKLWFNTDDSTSLFEIIDPKGDPEDPFNISSKEVYATAKMKKENPNLYFLPSINFILPYGRIKNKIIVLDKRTGKMNSNEKLQFSNLKKQFAKLAIPEKI